MAGLCVTMWVEAGLGKAGNDLAGRGLAGRVGTGRGTLCERRALLRWPILHCHFLTLGRKRAELELRCSPPPGPDYGKHSQDEQRTPHARTNPSAHGH